MTSSTRKVAKSHPAGCIQSTRRFPNRLTRVSAQSELRDKPKKIKKLRADFYLAESSIEALK
jgi:hypothetical protein